MALEGLVLQHLRAWPDCYGERNALYFWRTRAGLEVDFVIYTPTEFVAIEVKNSAAVKNEDIAGLKAFRDDYPECRTIILNRGRRQTMVDGILVAPAERFLKELVPNAPLPDKSWRAGAIEVDMMLFSGTICPEDEAPAAAISR